MKTIILALFIFMVSFISNYESNSVVRCVIEPKSVEGALNSSQAVFAGEVVEVKTVDGVSEARFRVEQIWKGVETEEIAVLENSDFAESPHYQKGESYLVFASMRDGKLFTGMCSRTKTIKYAQGDLQQLGEGRKPKK